MGLFPYPHREGQAEMVRQVREAVEAARPLVMESGTGTGKTAVSLAGVLEALQGSGRRAVYLTRTKSQQLQVIREAAAIRSGRGILCVGMQGRSSATCPLMRDDPELAGGTSEELSRLCSAHKRPGADGRPACRHYAGVDDEAAARYADLLRRSHPSPEEFAAACIADGVCPYEMSKRLLREADVIAAPYPFVFSPAVSIHFHDWIGRPPSDTVLIVDEAHNLPGYLRGLMSCECTARSARMAAAEAERQGDPEVLRGIRVTEVAEAYIGCLEHAMGHHLDDEDGLLPYGLLQEWMMERFGLPSTALDGLYAAMFRMGEEVCAARQAEFRLPRSHIRAFAGFLLEWGRCDEESYVHLVVGGDRPRLEAYCLDPCEAAAPLRECLASVSMSGTLRPLRHYTDELGLDGAIERVFPSPFPAENLLVLHADDVSTSFEELRQDPDCLRRISDRAVGLLRAVPCNSAVFFPSYNLMERLLADGFPGLPDRPVFLERRGMPQSELMDLIARFSASEDGILLSVSGGRISEGMDFPGRELELAILVGVPFPRPTARQKAVTRYLDHRFGDGWEYASKVPAQRRMRQSIGRLIRSEGDRGAVLILDRRAAALEGLDSRPSADPVAEIRAFFDVPDIKIYK